MGCARTLAGVRWLLGFLLVLAIIGGGMKVAGMKLPLIDYPLGGLFRQPQVQRVQPDLNLP